MPRAPMRRRLVAALVVGALVAVLGTGTAAAGADDPPPGPAPSYGQLLVKTAAEDLRLPWLSLPRAVSGVLGTRNAARVEALRALEERLRAAVAEAYAAALRADRAEPFPIAGRRTSSGCTGEFDCFKPCTLDIESEGNYGAVSPDGRYRGAWQFDQQTWNGAVSRAGYPEWSGRDPASAPPDVQDAAARQLYSERGNQPWGGRC
jgi:hypothetical protein